MSNADTHAIQDSWRDVTADVTAFGSGTLYHDGMIFGVKDGYRLRKVHVMQESGSWTWALLLEQRSP